MKCFVSIIATSIVFLLIPFTLLAQEEATLEEVVVTATRDLEEIRKVPANVTIITQQEIEESNSQTTIDLLRDKVGVVVRDFYGTGKKASADVRGFGETASLNTLVLVDGRRVNEIDLSGVDWSQIPLDQIERIEVVRGAGSVLYGDNAVGGVINIITKKPEKPISASVEGVVGSYHYNKESGIISGKWGPLSALLNAGYNATEGYRDNGFFRAKDVGGNIAYELSEMVRLHFSGSFHHDDSGLPGGLPTLIYKEDRRATLFPDDKATTDDGYGTLGIKANLWDFGRLEADLSFRQREVDDFFRSYSFKDERNLRTWGFTPRYVLEKPIWSHANKLIVGLDFYDSDLDVDSQSRFFGPNRLEVKRRSTGLYLLDQFSVLEDLILSVGYRQEWVRYDLFQEIPRAEDENHDHEPAWNFSLDYMFGKKSSAFLSFKRSFRFPVSDELVLVFPTFRVNPGIKPQTGYHYEGGIRHVFNDHIEGNLTFFWIDLHDEIFYNPVTFSNENFPKTRRKGIEAGLKARAFPWLSFWANYGYLRPELRSPPYSGNDIPGVPRHKGSIGADLSFLNGFLFRANLDAVGSSHFISDWANQVERLDGYYSLNARLAYTWKGLKAFIGVNNITNQKYAEWGVTNGAGTVQLFYPSPERNVFGGISYAF